MQMLPILIAVVSGYVISLIAGIVDFAPPIADAAWFGVPELTFPKFSWEAIAIIAPVAIVTLIEHWGGDINANGAVVGKDFVKEPGLWRTILGDGLATMLAGALGGPANTTYSENTATLSLTGGVYDPPDTSRRSRLRHHHRLLRQARRDHSVHTRASDGRHKHSVVRDDRVCGNLHHVLRSRHELYKEPDNRRSCAGIWHIQSSRSRRSVRVRGNEPGYNDWRYSQPRPPPKTGPTSR